MKSGTASFSLWFVGQECPFLPPPILNLQYIVFRIKAMDADAKTYTFKSESSRQLHQYNTLNFQPINSPTFKASQKAQSLPIDHNYKTTTKTQSSGPALTNSRRRRHRIFQQTRISSQEESLSAAKRKRNSIFGQINRMPGGQTEKVAIKKPTIDSALHQDLKSPFQCKQLIEKKLTERLNSGGFGLDTHIKEKVAMKQREIRYLRMEIERFKRCESINKQNQDLSRKLATKLKERANQSFYQKAIKQPAEAETPIHSLKQIKFTMAASQSPQKQTPMKIAANQPSHTAPLKTIPENEENQLYTQAKTQKLPTEPAVQFQTATKTKLRRERRSPAKLGEKDPIYLQIEQKLNQNHPSGCTRNINDIPLNMRLQEMNRHLESSFNAYARRAHSRPLSQSSQKTRRVDQSLKKSHYYIMMQ